MGEYFLRAFDEKLALLIIGGLEERRGNRSGLGASDQLLRRPPVRAPAVERIEDNIAAMRVIEPFDKFAGRVIKNGGVAARLDLTQHLHDNGGFAAASVADDLEMLVLGAQWNTQHFSAVVHVEADASALNGLVK